jgi:hypothetical protein
MTLEDLIAKQAITEVIYRYCRAFDRIDHDLALTIWHADGTCNYTNLPNTPDMLVRDYFPPSEIHRANLRNHSHQVSNILIEVAGGRAVSESYFTASLQTQPIDGRITEQVYRGRYLDRWSKREHRWAIDHRHVVFDSCTPYDFEAARIETVQLALSRRDRADPSYALFEKFRSDPPK